jgi:hypothetical protein
MHTLTLTGKEDALRATSQAPFRLLEPQRVVARGIVGDPETAKENLPTGVANCMLAIGPISSNQSDNGETHAIYKAGQGRRAHA